MAVVCVLLLRDEQRVSALQLRAEPKRDGCIMAVVLLIGSVEMMLTIVLLVVVVVVVLVVVVVVAVVGHNCVRQVIREVMVLCGRVRVIVALVVVMRRQVSMQSRVRAGRCGRGGRCCGGSVELVGQRRVCERMMRVVAVCVAVVQAVCVMILRVAHMHIDVSILLLLLLLQLCGR